MLLTVEQVSAQFGFSEQYIRKLIRTGKINADKVGNTWAIHSDEIDNISIEDFKKTNSNKIADRIGIRKPSKRKLNTLSFFSGALGLDIGLEKAGFNILLTCEVDEPSRQTIVANDKEVGLIGNILDYSLEEILTHANVTSVNDIDVIVGGPPCQAFSTAGKRIGFADSRGNVFLRFIDLIAQIRPKYAVIENVRGLLSIPMTVEIDDEVTETFSFDPKKISGAAIYYIQKKLESFGYNVAFNLYNAANYGVPQTRERVVIICSREGGPVPYLSPTNSEHLHFGLPPWKTFREAVAGLDKRKQESLTFSQKRLEYIKLLGPGQNWRDLPKNIQPIAMGNSYLLGGGKTGFYRRLDWDKPAPTLVTHPAMPATELAHPVENRPLSVQEYKRIQQFPDDWIIEGSIIDKYKQIGNAVPIGLGMAIGTAIAQHSKGKQPKHISHFNYSRYKNTSDKEIESFILSQKNKYPKKSKSNLPEFNFR